jgi:hypothetical protein
MGDGDVQPVAQGTTTPGPGGSGAASDVTGGIRAPSRRQALLSLVPTMVVDVALPLATYYVLAGVGVPDLWALLLSGVWPVLSSVVSLVRHRRLDEFGVFILVVIVAGALSSVLFDDPRLLLLKSSVFTGVLGIAFLASLFGKRPLMFYFGRRFGTDGSPAGLARWDGFWDDLSVFRRGQRTMTLVWGLTFVAEAVVRIPLVYLLPVSVGVAVSDILPFVVIAALVFWTVSFAKRNAAASKAQANQPL